MYVCIYIDSSDPGIYIVIPVTRFPAASSSSSNVLLTNLPAVRSLQPKHASLYASAY